MTSDFPSPHGRVARVAPLYNAQEYAAAAALARQLLQASPDEGRLWELYGACLCNLHDHEAAREALEQAGALVPLHPLAQIALAYCYRHFEQDDLAKTIYRHLVDSGLCPTCWLPSVAAGLNALADYAWALKACRILTDRDPTHHQGFFGIAYYLSKLRQSAELLIGPLSMAMDLAPRVLHYRLNLAFALTKVGRLAEAHELLLSVTPKDVHCPCWLRRMQAIFEQAGDKKRAHDCQEILALRNAR